MAAAIATGGGVQPLIVNPTHRSAMLKGEFRAQYMYVIINGQTLHLVKQRQGKRFDSGRHFGFELRRDLAHAGIGPQTPLDVQGDF